MRSLRVLTAATVEPVTLEEAKLHLRVDGDDDDTLIEALIAASRDYCERFTGLALSEQTLEFTVDASDEVFLPLAPVTSITSVTSLVDNVETVLVDATDYWANIDCLPAQIKLFDAYVGVLKIVYTSAPDSVPPLVKSALLLKLGMLYSDRGGENTNEYADEAIDNLLRPYRITYGMA